MLRVIPLPDALPVAVECREVVRDCSGVPCFADCRVLVVCLSERTDSGGFRLFRFVKRVRHKKEVASKCNLLILRAESEI